MCNKGFQEGIKLDNGATFNAQFVGVDRGTVPGFPFIVHITPNAEAQVKFAGVLHEKAMGKFSGIPVVAGRRSA